MRIEWINHASFLLETEELALVSDSWIEGRVFNQSWELIAASKSWIDRLKNG